MGMQNHIHLTKITPRNEILYVIIAIYYPVKYSIFNSIQIHNLRSYINNSSSPTEISKHLKTIDKNIAFALMFSSIV